MRLFCHNKEFEVSNIITVNTNTILDMNGERHELKDRIITATAKSGFIADGWIALEGTVLLPLQFIEARKDGDNFIGIFRVSAT